MRRLLIFDFDGVIVNSEPHHIAACEEIVRRLSGGRVGADAVHTVGGSTESLYRRALEVCGAAGDAAALAREHFALTLARIRRDAPRPEPELTALLDALDGRGVATAVATSSPAGFVREILALYDLAGRFPVVVTGDQAARLKPAPDVYLLALARCGADAACAAAIEDSRAGTLAAKAAGLYCLGYVNPSSGHEDLSAADRLIRRLSDAADAL